MSAPRYTTRGSVRGDCGHKHKSIGAAEACRAQDARACASLVGGAYSDRYVARCDGEPLSDDERRDIEDAREAES